jgi:hypothetical protein
MPPISGGFLMEKSMELTFTRGQKWSRIKIEASIELSFAFFKKNLPESIDPYATS